MYNYGAPLFQQKLASDDELRKKLILRGTVYSDDCHTPLPATLIEILHADNEGHYGKKRPGDFLEAASPFPLRGMLKTEAKGGLDQKIRARSLPPQIGICVAREQIEGECCVRAGIAA